MTQENKDLLLKDLCGRQMYNVKCKVFGDANPYTLSGVLHNKPYSQLYFEELDWKECDGFVGVEYCKPYLFPLSSMTNEQRIELYKALGWGYESHYHLSKEWEDFNDSIDNNDLFLPASWVSDLNKMYNWLHKNHFDYRGLVPMGLANDSTGLNIY